jgi:hypothetical protein
VGGANPNKPKSKSQARPAQLQKFRNPPPCGATHHHAENAALHGILWAGLTAAGNGDVANPEHALWAGFKPGSWVEFEQPCGKGALMQETYKLLEFSADQAVLECTKVENGFKYPLFQQIVADKLKAEDCAGAEAGNRRAARWSVRDRAGK